MDNRGLVQTAEDFEKFVENIFQRIFEEYGASFSSETFGRYRPDFTFSNLGKKIAVEVKIYGSETAPPFFVRNALRQIISIKNELGFDAGILVIGSYVNAEQVEMLTRHNPEILLLDLADIFDLAILVGWDRRLGNLLRETMMFGSARQSSSGQAMRKLELLGVIAPEKESIHEFDEEDSTHDAIENLITEIMGIPEGRECSKDYEETIEKALKMLFENHLTNWSSQKRSDSGMSINDLVARVSSDHDFWTILRTHFNSLYIIFEFKNYSRPIGQDQIFSTERYLFQPALRSTAIIVSRHGLNPNARKAAAGALREHGKLILPLRDPDIIEMLELHRSGDDPILVLSKILDEILVKIER